MSEQTTITFDIRTLHNFDDALNKGIFPMRVRIGYLEKDNVFALRSIDFEPRNPDEHVTSPYGKNVVMLSNLQTLRDHAHKRDAPEAILSVFPEIEPDTYIVRIVMIKSAARLAEQAEAHKRTREGHLVWKERQQKCQREAADRATHVQDKYMKCLMMLTDKERNEYEEFYKKLNPDDEELDCFEDGNSLFKPCYGTETEMGPRKAFMSTTDAFFKFLASDGHDDLRERVNKMMEEQTAALQAMNNAQAKSEEAQRQRFSMSTANILGW